MYKDESIFSMTREELQQGNIPVDILPDAPAVFAALAREMADTIRANNAAGRKTLMIVPLGPVGQYAPFADIVNTERLSLHSTTFLNMDEYMWDEHTLIEQSHPLSFRGAMQREFYSRVEESLLMPPAQRVFPSAENPAAATRLVQAHGGVDLCIGGIGLNGHVAFNEAAPGMPAAEFAALPTRVVPLAPESIVANGLNEYGGAYEFMPRFGVTVGFAEILAAKKIRLGCFRPWHKMVVRKAVRYPAGAEFPVTLLAGRDVRIAIPEALV